MMQEGEKLPAVDRVAQKRFGLPGQRTGGGVGFITAFSPAGAVAPSGVRYDVAKFPGRAVKAGVERAVYNHCPTDSGAISQA